jgi:threonine dehydratase
MRLGVRAKIFVPTISSPAKIARIRAYGAELEVVGDLYADALAASVAWVEQSGALPVHAFDQRETLLGQGTLGLELSEQAPLDTVLVGVGGGGLIGGIAAWYATQTGAGGPRSSASSRNGADPDGSAEGRAPRRCAGRRHRGGLARAARVGELMFPIARDHVAKVVLVSDDAIRRAQESLWSAVRIVAEPGGAAAFAALSSGGYTPSAGERVGVVVSGGNSTAVDFGRA